MPDGESPKRFEGRISLAVILAVVATSAASFAMGYDNGVSGGVAATSSFLKEFFPVVLRDSKAKNNYCRYDNQLFQFFTASMWIASLLGAVVASYSTCIWGRRNSIVFGGVLFVVGSVFQAAAQNLAMLVVGRLIQGVGFGYALQASSPYLAEVAPAQSRGKIMASNEILITFGSFCAGIVNWQSAKVNPWGWRLSLGLAGVLGLIWTLGALLLPDSPTSMLQRGNAVTCWTNSGEISGHIERGCGVQKFGGGCEQNCLG